MARGTSRSRTAGRSGRPRPRSQEPRVLDVRVAGVGAFPLLILTGPSGAGKTTVGRLVAEAHDRASVIETDLASCLRRTKDRGTRVATEDQVRSHPEIVDAGADGPLSPSIGSPGASRWQPRRCPVGAIVARRGRCTAMWTSSSFGTDMSMSVRNVLSTMPNARASCALRQ